MASETLSGSAVEGLRGGIVVTLCGKVRGLGTWSGEPIRTM